MPKNVLTDAEVKLTGYLSEKKYPESFRLIRYYDEEEEREFTFLTNAKQLTVSFPEEPVKSVKVSQTSKGREKEVVLHGR